MKAVMYHYVRPFDPAFPYFKNLRVDDFISQLDYFEKEMGFVSKEDFFNSFGSGRSVNGVVLTFDDGLRDHYDFVLPILKEKGLWGIFYIITSPLVNKTILDVHLVHFLLGKYGGKYLYNYLGQVLPDDIFVKKGIFNSDAVPTIKDNDDYTVQVKRVLKYIVSSGLFPGIIEKLMQDLMKKEFWFDDVYMDERKIKALCDEGMIIGSHTVSHGILSRLSRDEQEKEIAGSFETLENISGSLPGERTFCYPYGGLHSYNSDTKALLRKHNVKYAFSVETRDISSRDLLSYPLELPRFNCNELKYGKCREEVPV